MWRDDACLLDMLIAARRAVAFGTGLEWEDFERSDLHQQAVMRAIEIMGEAARKVSTETRNAHPEVPWNEVIGMRNRLVHEYFRIDRRKVWDTLRIDIPRLIPVLASLVPRDGDTGPGP